VIAARGVLLAAVAVGYGLALWRMPDVMHLTDHKDRHNARLLVISIGGAIVVAIGLLYTARNYRLTRRGQVTDRFVKALERLGSEHLYVRYGGVLALEQIVKDAPDQATHAAQVLGTFIRDRTPQRPRAEPDQPAELAASELPTQPPEDIDAALIALTRPASRRHVDRYQYIHLKNLHLTGAHLDKADLTRAQLDKADLTGAHLMEANLTGAQLDGANLTGAQLHGANLTRAWLHMEANLTYAVLDKANLSHARLTEANLASAILNDANLAGAGLSWAKLTGAKLDGANLTRAWLKEANLAHALLKKANLTGAQLDRTNLTYADLDGANLKNARMLTVSQVVLALPTRTTQLPTEIAADQAVKARITQVEEARSVMRGGTGSMEVEEAKRILEGETAYVLVLDEEGEEGEEML
jgi:uncharacterized protein YjbI with pentapeptide repeats